MAESPPFEHLGVFSDLIEYVGAVGLIRGRAHRPENLAQRIRDQQIRDHYSQSGHPEAYEGRFYPGPHKFDRAMQRDAFTWLKAKLTEP